MSLGSIDFSMPPAVAVALVNALLFPAWLAGMARLRVMKDRHALCFLASAVFMTLTSALSMWALAPVDQTLVDAAVGLCVILGALLFYLEVWALMTRGYTLGILLTLLKTGRPLTAQEIFDGYRDGDGLGWIMSHRLGGLCASGFIARSGDQLTLAPGRGVFIARLHRLCVTVLGLKRTG